MNVKNA
ncbi:putative membrane protein, partial [Vibrio parahaemolyticus AQ3810]